MIIRLITLSWMLVSTHAFMAPLALTSAVQGSTSSLCMAAISPAAVKELRESTGAGMMDCKKALEEAGGDREGAVDFLRKKGLAKADKKAKRVATEGRITFALKDNKGILIETNCETDFVASDLSFVQFCDKITNAALEIAEDTVEALSSHQVNGESIESTRQQLVSTIGENIQIRRVIARGGEGSSVGAYVHMDRIGVLVELKGGTPELCKDLAMHIAAMNPIYGTIDDIPEETVKREQMVQEEQARASGKPESIIQKMVVGRVQKNLQELCLVNQKFVKDNTKTVAKLLKESKAQLVGFDRICVGEGIEKEAVDFAAEVAKMAGKS
eukprot:Nitzschia sp. Nitz4//scaffold31_size150131//36606//37589//NITZ4_002815-RA/size150131-processed-gene-0.101-mRNA-1//1//CDS//3329547620//242//frame0